MPSRNSLKQDTPESYYHIYARGINKETLFCDDADYAYYLKLLNRYLSGESTASKAGVVYPTYHEAVELLAYCLMGNHFHLLIYQKEQGAMASLMRSLMMSYSRYFNLKYKRTGSVYEGRYKASRIDAQNYLEHISRYIHLNPRYWKRYAYSSIEFYKNGAEPKWLKTERVIELFASRKDYIDFLADYEEHKHMLQQIKHELADQ